MRPIDADNLKKRISKFLNELGPTITDKEFEKLIICCIEQEPMCDLDKMQDIIDFYKNH